MTRVLVTCAAYPTGRNAVRTLIEQEGIEVFASCSREALTRLPFDTPKIMLPKIEDPTFIDTLHKVCLDHGIDVILPGLEAMSIVLSKNKARFAKSGIEIPLPEYDVLMRGVDKGQFMTCVKAAGLPYVNTVRIRSEAEITRINSLIYPIIAKPVVGHGARGVLIYDRPPANWNELKKALRKSEMLVQEYIPGGAGSIHACCFVFDHQHRIKMMFQQKSTKTEFEFGGPAFAGVSIREPRLREYAEHLMRQIGAWTGIVMLEFKRHEQTGELYAMDCNARIWGFSSIADDAGMSFPLGAVLVAQNRNFRTHEDYLTGVQTERQGLVDHSTYTFTCGTQVDRRPVQAANGVRIVAFVPDPCDRESIASAVSDSEVHAVIVVLPESAPEANHSPKLHFWRPPKHLQESDRPYFMAHLFRASEVRLWEHGTCRKLAWTDLRRAWWFESGDTSMNR
jgi:carbamoyl-phosphate synthase large subunit